MFKKVAESDTNRSRRLF